MPSTRSQEFLNWLLGEISQLPPDSCLPTDKTLAQQWGLSNITVQRMLADLRNQGKVVRIPGKGTFTPSLDNPALRALEVKADTTRESSVEHLCTALIRLVSEGVYRRGDALPPVKFIRSKFKVSSETVTMAYQKLEQMDYVEKIGKTYWVGRFENLVNPGQRNEVYFFRFGGTDFRDIFQSDPIALAFQKMERELYSHGYFLHPEDAEKLFDLAHDWERKKKYPAGLLFHAVTEAHQAFLLQFLEKFPGLKKSRVRILVHGSKGDLSPLARKVHVISRGNVDTNVARVMAHYLLSQGHREANFSFDESELSGTSHFHWFFKIAMAVKTIVPDFVFRSIVKPNPNSSRQGPFFQSLNPSYQRYLSEKYPKVSLRNLEEHLYFTDDVMETCARFPSTKVWLFSHDEKAAEALTWLKRKGIHVPEDLQLIGFENDPRYYHLGLSCCSADWEQLGYAMAHALIGDIQLAKSNRGFIKVRCQMVDKLTTLPYIERKRRPPSPGQP